MLPISTSPKKEDRIIICQAHRKKDGKPCSRLARKGEKFCWQHSPRFWGKFRKVATIIGSIAAAIILYTTVIKNVYDVKYLFFPSATATSTQTSTATLTATSTFTSTPIPTSTPTEHGIFYMIVLDASLKMQESFETESKWDAALRAVNAILEGREHEANYGLVVIGGSESQGSANPCDQPTTVAVPFSSRDSVVNYTNQLRPSGGGSIFTAFNLAKDQFRYLPENTVRSLVFITGSSDSCESRDEWRDLQRLFDFPGGIGIVLYSEIIVLEQNAVISRTIEEQFDSLSVNLNVQAPQTTFQLVQTNNTVINNISNYVNNTIASIPTNIPASTPTNTSTPRPAPAITLPPPVEATTVTPSYTPSFTPSWTPSLTPSLTQPPILTVMLTGYDYIGTGEGCSANIYFQVNGGPVSGYFRVTNDFYRHRSPPYDNDPGYPFVALLDYPNGFQVGLGGSIDPVNYYHEVWFEYNGVESNHLSNLICPGLTPPTPTP